MKNGVKRIKNFLNLFGPAIVVFLLIILLFKFVLLVSFVPTSSMENTIARDSIILSTRIHKSINRGDIIVFWLEEENKILIKRVVGIAGDKIEICDDKVYINGNPEAGVYFKGKTKIGDNDLKIFTIPADSLFVLGDNRENSKDSRSYNNPYISIKDVMGKYKETIYTKRGLGSTFLNSFLQYKKKHFKVIFSYLVVKLVVGNIPHILYRILTYYI